MFEKIVLASGNTGKLNEFSRLFADLNIEVLPQSQFNTPECPEPYHTFVENALAKARHAAKYSGLPALADDSGICTNALNGAPGIFSARYAGENPKSDAANNAKLSADLADKDDKSCYYVCILVLVRHEKRPATHHCRRYLARTMADRSSRHKRLRLRSTFLSGRTWLHRRRA